MDTTLFISGGLGSGKTLVGALKCKYLIARQEMKWLKKIVKIKIYNYFAKMIYKAKLRHWSKKKGRKKPNEFKPLEQPPRPTIYSTAPLKYKPLFKKQYIYSAELTKEHLTLKKGFIKGSVIFIDEIAQVVTQFDWNLEDVKGPLNELVTFFRHYVQGYLVITSQSDSDVVAQIRRKMNINIWCYNFEHWGPIFRNKMCDMHMSDNITSTSSTYIADNTRWHYGLYLGFISKNKWIYDTLCYSERYNNIAEKDIEPKRHKALKTNYILRFGNYKSPLDKESRQEE